MPSVVSSAKFCKKHRCISGRTGHIVKNKAGTERVKMLPSKWHFEQDLDALWHAGDIFLKKIFDTCDKIVLAQKIMEQHQKLRPKS